MFVRPVGTVVLAFVALISSGCSSHEIKAEDHSTDEAAKYAASSPSPSENAASKRDSCLLPWPSPMKLSGRVRREERFGPPGYGENPRTDERVTIYLLDLRMPVDVCADTTRDAAHPAVRGVGRLQLTGRLDPNELQNDVGRSLTVFGSLNFRAWGSDYTEVLIHVDSVPGTRVVVPQST
jgi:hypothetical protein